MHRKPNKTHRIYKKDDKIFAKVKGSPFWPARVESTPKELLDKNRYNIRFYGTDETYVAKDEQLLPYSEENMKKHGQKRRITSFNDAIYEIANDPIGNKTRTESSVEKSKASEPAGPETKVVEKILSKLVGSVVKSNIKRSEECFDMSSEDTDLNISHNTGKKSYEVFCKYLSQFESVTSEQIQYVKNIFENLADQIEPKIVSPQIILGNENSMVDEVTMDQNIVDIVKNGVEIERTIESTN